MAGSETLSESVLKKERAHTLAGDDHNVCYVGQFEAERGNGARKSVRLRVGGKGFVFGQAKEGEGVRKAQLRDFRHFVLPCSSVGHCEGRDHMHDAFPATENTRYARSRHKSFGEIPQFFIKGA
jgi:hypothetical protein